MVGIHGAYHIVHEREEDRHEQQVTHQVCRPSLEIGVSITNEHAAHRCSSVHLFDVQDTLRIEIPQACIAGQLLGPARSAMLSDDNHTVSLLR